MTRTYADLTREAALPTRATASKSGITAQSAQDGVHGRYPRTTHVWVRLDGICARIPGQPHRVIDDGLDMEGEVSGLLSSWIPTARGDWLGVVTFQIPYADGRPHKFSVREQLVPAYALRKRDDPGERSGPGRG